MNSSFRVRPTREELARDAAERGHARYAVERRMQLMSLLVLALAVLVGTVLFVGWRNVFPPGWWRFW